jgi:hypothetical protein
MLLCQQAFLEADANCVTANHTILIELKCLLFIHTSLLKLMRLAPFDLLHLTVPCPLDQKRELVTASKCHHGRCCRRQHEVCY